MKDIFVLKWVKNTIAVLIIAVFVIGIFSQSLVNYFIPKVYLDEVIEGQRLYMRVPVTGSIEAREVKDITLGRAVIVERFEYLTGQYIKQGMPLFRIDMSYGITDFDTINDPLETQVAHLQMQLKMAREQLSALGIKHIKLKEEIIRSKERLDQYKALYDQDGISLMTYEGHVKAHEALLDQALAYDLETTRLQADILNTESQVKNQSADLRQGQVLLNYMDNVDADGVFYSPYNGVILSQAKEGQVIGGQEALMTVALVNSYDDVDLNVLVTEEVAANLGIYKTFYFDDGYLPIEEWSKVQVKFKSFIPVGDKLLVKLQFKNKNGIPLMGDEIKGDIITRSVMHQYVVPRSAIRQTYDDIEGGGTFVYAVEEKKGVLGTEQVVREIPVSIRGASDDLYVPVNSDLVRLRGLKLIKNLSYKIKDGARVLIMDEE